MKRLAIPVFAWATLSVAGPPGAEEWFEKEIRPVLVNRCVSCHGPERQDASVRLDSRSAVVELGWERLEGAIRGRVSVPASCVLEDRAADAFASWAARGFSWPEGRSVAARADREEVARSHWAFQPVQEPAIPRNGAPTPVDAFLRARLEAAGLQAAPEVDRRTLIRRLSYTLTGLPPAMEEVERFAGDPDPAAYEGLVDRLLDAEHYGEHWARHWMDVARYSDTKGYVYAREEKNWPHAWVYRDWLVRALNEDMPYDRFLLLQLAADQVEDRRPGDLAAMGLLTIGRRFLGVKHEIIDDRIDVVTRGALGLTVGCARCHDHKYDPISSADYYSLHGIFDSSVERLVPVAETGEGAFWQEHAGRVAKLEEALANFKAEAAYRARERLRDYLNAQTELDKYPADGFDQRFHKTDLLPAFVHAWRDYLWLAGERQDPVFVPWHLFAALPEEGFAELAAEVRKKWPRTVHPAVEAAFEVPPQSFEEVIDRYAALLRDPAEEELRRVVQGAGSPCEVPEGPLVNTEIFFDTDTVGELWKLENEIARAILKAPEPVPFALTLADRTHPVDSRLLLRGNPLTPGQMVPRRNLGLLSAPEAPPFSQGSGRLELAQAIIDPANPLTARVMVNRVWAQHFGQGLVETPSDFGTRAEAPSHPELLDWLAARFLAEGWSLKWLHRQILTSAAFRQSSAGPASVRALAVDPGNRLLWRMNPHRLGYEEIRDAMMAAPGDLDRALGGRPVEGLREPFSQRRALYARVDRQSVPGTLRVFDFANPDLHMPRRNETTVPQQALFFLNHPFLLDRVRALARATDGMATPEARVRELFRRSLQREPSVGEVAESLALIEAAADLDLPVPPRTAADWRYGTGVMDEEAQRVTGFKALPHFTGTAWQGGADWPDAKLGWAQLTAAGGHPGNDLAHAVVRRWTAPRDLSLSIRSHLVHEPEAGDGIRAFVVSSRVGLLASAKLHAGKTDLQVEALPVKAGETVDFAVDIGGGLNNDQFLWDIRLAGANPDLEQPALEWKAESDFTVNTVAPLTAWEQLAQAILCSNEFLFVD